MPQVKTKKQVFLQNAWKKAYKEGSLIIDLGKAAANQKQRLRMMLYNAVKLAKQNLDEDYELNMAAQEVEIVNGEDPTKLYMRKIVDSPLMQALANSIGTTMDQAVDPIALEAQERMLAGLRKLGLSTGEENPAPVPTPAPMNPLVKAYGARAPGEHAKDFPKE